MWDFGHPKPQLRTILQANPPPCNLAEEDVKASNKWFCSRGPAFICAWSFLRLVFLSRLFLRLRSPRLALFSSTWALPGRSLFPRQQEGSQVESGGKQENKKTKQKNHLPPRRDVHSIQQILNLRVETNQFCPLLDKLLWEICRLQDAHI
jgi:hypothetical protein